MHIALHATQPSLAQYNQQFHTNAAFLLFQNFAKTLPSKRDQNFVMIVSELKTQPKRSASSFYCTLKPYTFQRHTLHPAYLYQKDERVLPTNIPRCNNEGSVSQYTPALQALTNTHNSNYKY
jgi:hypothetical protein